MAAPVIQTCHVACCANRTPNVVSWSKSGLIAFGTCHSVALYNPPERITVGILNGHTARVNAVQWVKREDGGPETELVSGASDNNVIVWTNAVTQAPSQVKCVGHTAPVCAVDAIYLDGGARLLIASVASDSTVKLWLREEGVGKVECLQTLSFGSGFMMDVSLALLPGSRVPVLACGGDDSKVHIYVRHKDEFQRVLSLQGHEDWIRGVEWAAKDGELLLASCAQDCLIRLWRLFAKAEPPQSLEAEAEAEAGQGEPALRLKEDLFQVAHNGSSAVFAVSLETVLAGHENWVYGVHWHPAYIKDGKLQQPLSLLSASMDKTMILWSPEEGSGVWVEKVRVGEVGGNTLGFYGCQMSPDGSMILAHAFHGALHLWQRNDNQDSAWSPAVVVSGHFSSVQDLSWDPDGEFVLSVGSDQTTRLFTPWRGAGAGGEGEGASQQLTWHEICRPQIHGYDMQCLAPVGRFQFVSGADEKVLRVFRAPRNFVENFANISGTPLQQLLNSSDTVDLPEGASTPALGLSNKAVFQGDLMSQTTKGEDGDYNSVSDQYKESYFHPLTLSEPPPEDHLLQNTLWPEVQKLYGHGFELFCLASDSSRTYVASACKAAKAEHASILLWSASCWRRLQALACHSLTVTQMAFSPDARLLLAVSRDRTWSLWRRQETTSEDDASNTELPFSLYAHTGKDTAVHSRIIWSCDWSFDNKYFVTSSRDKKVIVWGHGASGDLMGEGTDPIRPCGAVLDVGDSATAVAFCPHPCPDGSYLLAVGLESGRILLYKWRPPGAAAAAAGDQTSTGSAAAGGWTKCGETDASYPFIKDVQYVLFSQSHTLPVKRLRWRPRAGRAGQGGRQRETAPQLQQPGQEGGPGADADVEGEEEEEAATWVQLASAGDDHAVKIFNVSREAVERQSREL
ncbi:elongator complex protein 2 [Engraulis encrasicolus]|uniref:elongator complex protein 2 n=1 Tax=Engraulis encrasicolus TaxID=184585 RepID=UPI002FD66F90